MLGRLEGGKQFNSNDRLKRIANHLDGNDITQRSTDGAENLTHVPVILGAAILDIQATPEHGDIQPGGTVPGSVTQSPGGVGRNIAQALAQLTREPSKKPLLITIIGSDLQGDSLRQHWLRLGFRADGFTQVAGIETPAVAYCFNADGSVAAGVASVSQLEKHFTPSILNQHASVLRQAPLVVLDGNLPESTIQAVCKMTGGNETIVVFEPVSSAKAVRGLSSLPFLSFISPNAQEAVAMAEEVCNRENLRYGAASELPSLPNGFEGLSAFAQIRTISRHLSVLFRAGAKAIILTLGPHGAALLENKGSQCTVTHLPALPATLANTSGAGDCLVAAFCAGLLTSHSKAQALAHGVAAAKIAIESSHNVPVNLQLQNLQPLVKEAVQKLQTWCFDICI